jgi:signal transduction histidine kinase
MQRMRNALESLLELAAALVSPPIPMTESEESEVSAEENTETIPESVTASHQHEHETLRSLADLCGRVLGTDRVAIIGIDQQTGLLIPIAVTGRSPKRRRQFRTGLTGLRLEDRFDPAVIAQLSAGQAVLIDLDRLKPTDPGRAVSKSFFLIAPMLAEGRLMGYIGVNFGDEANDYSSENIALTQATAQLIGIVIERQRLAREREEARLAAQASNQAKEQMDEFLSIAGHELRSPITSAKANVQLVTRQLGRIVQDLAAEQAAQRAAEHGEHRDEPATYPLSPAATGRLRYLERAYDLLQRTQRQFARQERLITDLLDVSRIDAGRLDLHLGACDLAQLVVECVNEQQTLHPQRTIEVTIPPGQPLYVRADADRLAQVITNMLSNAIKYSAPESPVRVQLGIVQDGAHARCEVIDQGPGMDERDRELVWQRFYRIPGREANSGSPIGLGLGLHISKSIVERHNGWIGVESIPGKGSTFWFELPLAPASES